MVLYHAGVRQLPGGFIGVDLFFVLSGYLVTALLLRERATNGWFNLPAFWVRRARRLLPALIVMLIVCSPIALLVGNDAAAGLRVQAAGAMTFSSNWLQIADGSSYIERFNPQLFTHLWSLAVEEQFYLVWPLLLAVLIAFLRHRAAIAVVLLALGSAALMGLLVVPGTDPSRVYLGTETHAFGLLLGAALALWRPRSAIDGPTTALTARVRGWISVMGGVGLTVVVAGAVLLTDHGTATFRGGLLVVNLGALLLIAAVVSGEGSVARLMSQPPLRWLGQRSYAVYLWHWPALLIVAKLAPPNWPQPAIAGAAVAATLLFAEVSWHAVEQPIRRLGFRGALKRAIGANPAPRLVVASRGRLGLATMTVVAGLALGAVLVAPTQAIAADQIAAGEEAIAAAAAGSEATQVPETSSSTASPSMTTESTAVSPSKELTPGSAAPPGPTTESSSDPPVATATTPAAPPPTVPDGSQVLAIGDSVMLASAPELLQAFPGIDIDAQVNRQIWDLPSILAADAARYRPFVVIGLGTNGTQDAATILQTLDVLGPDRRVVLVNASGPMAWRDDLNQQLLTVTQSRPHTCLADWHSAIADHSDLLAPDQVHPGTAGGQLYANAVAGALLACNQ